MISKTTRFLTHVFMGLSTCVALTGCLAESGSADDPQSEGDDTALSATAVKTTCEEFGQIRVDDGAFIVQNDRWGATTKQCVSAAGTTASFTVSTSLHTKTDGAPAGYPSLFKGCAYGTCTKDAASVMKQVNDITSMKSTWIVSVPDSGIYDVAYDIWYNHQKPTTNLGQNNGTEIMVWINKRGSVMPFGRKIADAVSINGAKWDVYFGAMTGSGKTWDVVSYLRQGAVTSVAFDLVNFAKDAKARNHLEGTDYLTSVQAGFEVWNHAAGLATKSFNVIVK